MAKRAKIMQLQAQARLEPDLAQIDALHSPCGKKQALKLHNFLN
jgi:hypothetical protein